MARDLIRFFRISYVIRSFRLAKRVFIYFVYFVAYEAMRVQRRLFITNYETNELEEQVFRIVKGIVERGVRGTAQRERGKDHVVRT